VVPLFGVIPAIFIKEDLRRLSLTSIIRPRHSSRKEQQHEKIEQESLETQSTYESVNGEDLSSGNKELFTDKEQDKNQSNNTI
jgi:hypothetical protein